MASSLAVSIDLLLSITAAFLIFLLGQLLLGLQLWSAVLDVLYVIYRFGWIG
jgi:hypothetical protein